MSDAATVLTAPGSADLESVDLTDPSRFVDGPPHALFARMRVEAPVHLNNSRDGLIRWSLTKASDIRMVGQHPELFSSFRAGVWQSRDAMAPLDLMRNLLVIKDPSEHAMYQRILRVVFSPRTVAALEATVRRIVIEILEDACARGELDVVSDLAVPVPLRVIASLLGPPEEHLPALYGWTERLDRAAADPQGPHAVPVLLEMANYLTRALPARAGDRSSLVSALYRAEVDDQQLTEEEILMFFAILFFAGNDKTRNGIAHGMHAFLEHPDQFELLANRPSLMDRAVEEILRWATPLNYFARTATESTTIRGQRIAEGDRLLMWNASGNRDEELVSDPMRFDISRNRPDGPAVCGRHFGLGGALARLEVRIVMEELTRLIRDPRQVGDVARRGSMWVNGISKLPMAFVPR